MTCTARDQLINMSFYCSSLVGDPVFEHNPKATSTRSCCSPFVDHDFLGTMFSSRRRKLCSSEWSDSWSLLLVVPCYYRFIVACVAVKVKISSSHNMCCDELVIFHCPLWCMLLLNMANKAINKCTMELCFMLLLHICCPLVLGIRNAASSLPLPKFVHRYHTIHYTSFDMRWPPQICKAYFRDQSWWNFKASMAFLGVMVSSL